MAEPSTRSEFNAYEVDGVVLPGGFGAAKNWSDLAFKGAEFNVIEDLKKCINAMRDLHKPIGALCVSPVLVAKILGAVKVSIGNDQATVEIIDKIGADHQKTNHGEVCIDEENRVITTPCYMLDADIAQVAEGAHKLVSAMVKMIKSSR